MYSTIDLSALPAERVRPAIDEIQRATFGLSINEVRLPCRRDDWKGFHWIGPENGGAK